jgi:hypothetical protein
MNERILELARQVWPDPSVSHVNHEKFAELIVKECNRYACSAWEHGPLLGRDLLIHFGIVRLNDEQTY